MTLPAHAGDVVALTSDLASDSQLKPIQLLYFHLNKASVPLRMFKLNIHYHKNADEIKPLYSEKPNIFPVREKSSLLISESMGFSS